MRWLLMLCLGCGSSKSTEEMSGSDSESGAGDSSQQDTSTDTGAGLPVSYSIERVGSATILDHEGMLRSLSHPVSGTTFVLDGVGEKISTLSHMWVHPYGSYCLGGSYDDDGVCRGGTERESGVISSPQPTRQMCMDADNGMLVLVKASGERLEMVDLEKDGPDPYTYNQVLKRVELPAQLTASGSYTGPCVVLPDESAVVLSSRTHGGLAVVSGTEPDPLLRMGLLEFEPLSMFRSRDSLWLLDGTNHRVVSVRTEELTEAFSVDLPEPGVSMVVGQGSRSAWVQLASGSLLRVEMGAAEGDVHVVELDGEVTQVVADGQRNLAWALTTQDGAHSLTLISPDGVEDSQSLDDTVVGLGDPTSAGDVPVFLSADGGGLDVQLLAARPEEELGPPLYSFLLTTIEEPSDLNMDLPCEGGETDFARELALIRHNAARLASFDVPVAVAITDNFAEKSEACGETGIFDELAGLGFTLGVMLHNRPCFNCTDGSHDANPQVCARSSPYWIQAANTSACFPDHPEYCAPGDWDCYRDLMTPRVGLVDRNIPGGGRFIVGGDRHRMWEYDWIRLYQEVERPTVERRGFDLSMFASAWAFDGVGLGDARGKDLAPWNLEHKTSTWHLGDIEHWTQDAPRSELIYFPGLTWSTVKLGEQQKSGLYMIDFFSSGAPIAYDYEDYEAVYQDLRAAIAGRQTGRTNTWYFHIHDLGTLNLRDVNDEPLMTDPDGDGPDESVPTESLLESFLERVNDRYGETGVFLWQDPGALRDTLD